MRVQIKNFVGIAKADLEIEAGITLVAGDNAMGKTSVLRGLGALLTGEPVPKGLGKAEALVMDGCKSAELSLVNGTASAAITYPNPKFVAQGEPPQASAIAAGTLTYTDLPEKERATFLVALLRATPTPDQLRQTLKDELGGDDIAALLNMLKSASWDDVCERMRERRTKLKGKWEDLTGERWGDRKSKDWLPQAWDERTDSPHAMPTPQQRLVAAQEAFDKISQEAYISEGEHRALKDLAGKREPTQMSLDLAKRQLPSIEADWAKLRGDLDAMAAPDEDGIPCPHCGAHVIVARGPDGTKLLPLQPALEGEAENRKAAIDAKREKVAEAYKKLEYQQGLIGACEQTLREIAAAEAKLKGARKGNGEDRESKLRKAKEALEGAQASAARARQAQEAQDLAERVRYHDLIVDVLGPDGLRRTEMEKKLAAFEAEVLALTKELITWKPLTIDRKTLLPAYGGRPYVLCSKSEQWRVNATLQVAIALLQGAAMVCLDGADILARNGQEDLLAGLLDRLPFPVVVGATYDRQKDAPDLAAAGIGRVYWIANGVAEG
jgi:hypothetical protein